MTASRKVRPHLMADVGDHRFAGELGPVASLADALAAALAPRVAAILAQDAVQMDVAPAPEMMSLAEAAAPLWASSARHSIA